MTDKPVSTLPWTGERYVPEVAGLVALEHLHRYAFACEHATGKAVLDIACGEGYGSAMLAGVAARVLGIDRAVDVAQHASRRYTGSNLRFAAGSCDNIPLRTRSIDLVVSFETLEHIHSHEDMLAEIKRVLRRRGTLILSSPEKGEYSDAVSQANPFHVKELYGDEFRALVSSHFRHVAIAGQRVIFGSGIFREDLGGAVRTYSWNGLEQESAAGMLRGRRRAMRLHRPLVSAVSAKRPPRQST